MPDTPSSTPIPLLLDLPTVEDIDHWHDTDSLGDLYIWCLKLREEVIRLRPSPSVVARADVQHIRAIAARGLAGSPSSHKATLEAIITHSDKALGHDTGRA